MRLFTFLSTIWPVGLVALLAWVSIIACLDPGGSYPQLPQGPGQTVDEIFNVEQGVFLVNHARGIGWYNLVPGTSYEAYKVKNGYNPDHPPLGRLWLGLHHEITAWLAPPAEPVLPFVTACARTGSATAFALTLLLIGGLASFWSGRAAGVMTAISLCLMPRVYGHAHLASLETITNLTCTAAVLAVAAFWNGPQRPTRRAAVCAGLCLGLAFLTKMQAIFIPLPVILWTLWRWRLRAIVPLIIWGVTALVIFFAGWPYLWSDTLLHLREYFGRTTNRAALSVWYFGQKYADKSVPWHYPLVMFALTVPAALHVLGLAGLSGRKHLHPQAATDLVNASPDDSNRRHRDLLVLGCLLLPLIVFSLPNVAVYDCERLFLTSFPLWALFVGRGWVRLWQGLRDFTQSKRISSIAWSLLLAVEVIPLFSMAPCHLCYYNSLFQLRPSLVETASLEVDYWGTGITRELLQKTVAAIPAGSKLAIIPTLHPFQAAEIARQSPILRRHGIETVENRDPPDTPAYALVFHRRADLPPNFHEELEPEDVIAITERGGLWIAYLKRMTR